METILKNISANFEPRLTENGYLIKASPVPSLAVLVGHEHGVPFHSPCQTGKRQVNILDKSKTETANSKFGPCAYIITFSHLPFVAS